jgi:hypothetical protein
LKVESKDQRCVMRDVHDALCKRIRPLDKLNEKKYVQWLGDGFGQWQRTKFVNLCGRVYQAREASSAISTLDPIGIWDGKEDYATIKLRTKTIIDYMKKCHKQGGIVCDWPGKERQEIILVEWVGGGDMSWTHSLTGMGNWEWCIWCWANNTQF